MPKENGSSKLQVQCVLGRQYEGDIKGNLNAVRLAKLAGEVRKPKKAVREVIRQD